MKSKDIATILLTTIISAFGGWLVMSLLLPSIFPNPADNPEVVTTATTINPMVSEIDETIFDGDKVNNPAVPTKSDTQIDPFFRTKKLDSDNVDPDNPEGGEDKPEVN